MTTRFAQDVLALVSEALEIPPTHYKTATERYEALGRWLERDGSSLGQHAPRIYPQGSFRLGTVVRPMNASHEYDLDLVSELGALSKEELSQKQLKTLVGEELIDYAAARAMKSEPKEGKRCWHIDYADDVNFHIDVLPAIPEDDGPTAALAYALHVADADPKLASDSIAITDRTRPDYAAIHQDWPQSNPRGYGKWFDSRMREAALPRMRSLFEARMYASIDDVPAYEWKTPLQLAIQILKRHRDVMFQDDTERKPISIIISTLAARAYTNQALLIDAISDVADRMPEFVSATAPRVPNPVNPAEDFADKWSTAPHLDLEGAFREWLRQLRRDLDLLSREMSAGSLRSFLKSRFAIDLPEDRVRAICGQVPAVAAAPTVRISHEPKPWGDA